MAHAISFHVRQEAMNLKVSNYRLSGIGEGMSSENWLIYFVAHAIVFRQTRNHESGKLPKVLNYQLSVTGERMSTEYWLIACDKHAQDECA